MNQSQEKKAADSTSTLIFGQVPARVSGDSTFGQFEERAERLRVSSHEVTGKTTRHACRLSNARCPLRRLFSRPRALLPHCALRPHPAANRLADSVIPTPSRT